MLDHAACANKTRPRSFAKQTAVLLSKDIKIRSDACRDPMRNKAVAGVPVVASGSFEWELRKPASRTYLKSMHLAHSMRSQWGLAASLVGLCVLDDVMVISCSELRQVHLAPS